MLITLCQTARCNRVKKAMHAEAEAAAAKHETIITPDNMQMPGKGQMMAQALKQMSNRRTGTCGELPHV